MLPGFGYHGDFIMGWDETNFTLQDAVDTCTNLDGEIESCPLFTVISEEEQGECQFDMPATLAKEDVAGPIANLPGDIALAWGPAPANAAGSDASASVAATTAAVPTLSYSAGSTASVNGSYVPGNIFKATPTTTTVIAAATDNAVTTASDPLITLATSTYTYTGASGDITISEIVYEEAITWVTEMTTTTVYVEPTGVARRDAHAHVHRHRHARGHKH